MAGRKKTPAVTDENKAAPQVNTESKENPEVTESKAEMPEVTEERKENPEVTTKRKDPPPKGKPENMVMFGDRMIEIKPTKVRYQRDRTAAFYRVLELYPLVDILGMDATSFGDGRDGDKAVFDWLIAVTDDPELVKEYYDELDTDTIEKLMGIYRRVNKIDEKEEKLKNALTPGAKAKT